MTTTTTTPALDKFRALGDALNGVFFERTHEVRALLVAALAGEHVLFLGDPGTGKSALAQAFSTALGGTYFQRLVTKFSVPEELFGPFSLAGLEADRYERKTEGYLPTADVAFLDEIFKANSAILNSLLTLLNERAFDNGTQRERSPLKICIGASNELPNNDEGDALDALYDRFVLRRWVEPLKSRANKKALLRLKGAPQVSVELTEQDLAEARAFVGQVTLSEAAEDALLDLQEALAKECGIAMSDRRLRKCQKVLSAYAALQGRSVVNATDLEILADSLWNNPDERAPVLGQIMKIANPAKGEALKIYDAAVEAFESVSLKTIDSSNLMEVSRLRDNLRGMVKAIDDLGPSVEDVGTEVERLLAEVNQAVAAAF